MNFRESIVKMGAKALGIRVMDAATSLFPASGSDWWTADESDGVKRKAVWTEAFWLAPPYGRPRDIDYERLKGLEKSVWVRMCVQHVVDSIATARWNIVPRRKGDDVPEERLDEVRKFFEGDSWSETFSKMLRMMLPDLIQYDAGVILKAYPVLAYDENNVLKKEGVPPVELYARDGRSFLKDTDLYGRILQYWQYSWMNPEGRPIQFVPREVLYLQQNPQSRDPYGICNLEIIEEVLDYMMDSTLAQSKYWKNGLFIGGQIDLPEITDVNELKRQQAYYESKLRGPRKYNKWVVTGGGAKIQSMPFTPQQMQWLDSQKWFAKMVFGVFKVTPSELGFTEDLNRATGIQQMQIHKSKAIHPLLTIIEEVLNRKVIWSDFYDDVVFEFERGLDLADKQLQTSIDSVRLDKGLNSVNELRDRDGLEKWDDEKYDVPSGEQPEPPAGGQEPDLSSLFAGAANVQAISDDIEKGGEGSGIKGHKTQLSSSIQNALYKYEYMEKLSEKQLERFRKETFQAVSTSLDFFSQAYTDFEQHTKSVIEQGLKSGRTSKEEASEEFATHKKVGEVISDLKKAKKKLESAFAEGEVKIAIDGAFAIEHTGGGGAIFGSKRKDAERILISKELDRIKTQTEHKAANVEALSGEPGYVPMPKDYDGMKKPVKTKKKEKKVVDIALTWSEEKLKAIMDEIDRLYGKDFGKGGVGSGIKGHRTHTEKLPNNREKINLLLDKYGWVDGEIFRRNMIENDVSIHITNGKAYALSKTKYFEGQHKLEVLELEVNPPLQRKGYGIKTVADITKEAEEKGAEQITLHSASEDSDKFYRAIGMVGDKNKKAMERFVGDKEWMKKFLKKVQKESTSKKQ